MFGERLQQDHLRQVIDELENLSSQKTQFLKHNFTQVKNRWRDVSEVEMRSKIEYESSRMNKFMQDLLSKQREKRNHEMAANVKMIKAKNIL